MLPAETPARIIGDKAYDSDALDADLSGPSAALGSAAR